MSELQVEIPKLRDFGHKFEQFGTGTISQTGPHTRTQAGMTSDMDGLLDLIAPAIKLVADKFASHYDDLAKVIEGTGTALVKTADDYAKVDLAVAQAMDEQAVSTGGVTESPMGSGGDWSETTVLGQCHGAEADPAAEIRSDMSADVRAIDWVFNKFTGHHITEPIDSIVGNWTTLTARGLAWQDTSNMLKAHGDDILTNTGNVDGVWDGVAATSFKAYGTKLGDGLHAESEIPLAIKIALDKLASSWEQLYKSCVDLLQEVIHAVEIGAAALAAGWWCGVGEAVAAKKCQEALVAFYRAYKIVMMVKHVITAANLAVKGFEKLVDAYDLATHIPETIDGEIQDLKNLMSELGAIPEHLDNLSHLGDTPTSPYGGPRAPHVPA
jgi:hypothetical protein